MSPESTPPAPSQGRPVRLLLVGSDISLQEELRSALRSAQLDQVVIDTAPSAGRAADQARAYEPDVICFEMEADPAGLRRFADELSDASPRSALIGIYAQGGLGGAASESEFLIQALRSQVRDFLRRPISSDELLQTLRRHGHALRTSSEPSALGTVVSVVSAKGGVGKSTLASNLAACAARLEGKRVLLLDAGLQLGVAAAQLDLQPEHTIVDVARELDRLDDTLLREMTTEHRSGLRLLAAPKTPMEATQIDDEALARILAVARRSFDLVVVDTSPVLDSIAMAVIDRSDRVITTFSRTVPVLLGARPYLDTLRQLGVREEQLVVALNALHPSHSASLRDEDANERLGREAEISIPYDKAVLIAENTGQPAVLEQKRGAFGKAVRELCSLVLEGVVTR